VVALRERGAGRLESEKDRPRINTDKRQDLFSAGWTRQKIVSRLKPYPVFIRVYPWLVWSVFASVAWWRTLVSALCSSAAR
jgi:hypothetical protein